MGRFVLFCIPVLLPLGTLGAATFDHNQFDQVLQNYVDDQGLVDYRGLKSDRAALDAYIDQLGRFSPGNAPEQFPSSNDKLAYWINAYNAFVLRGIVDAYPIGSVKDIKILNGFFNRVDFLAGGEKMTLDHLENKIIRPGFKDPRIHFAVNCGAVSCPALANRAYRAAQLDQDLDGMARRFAADPKHVRLDLENNKLYLSKIMDWFGQDFIEWHPRAQPSPAAKPTLVDYLLLYLPPEKGAALRRLTAPTIEFNSYDWALNQQSRQED